MLGQRACHRDDLSLADLQLVLREQELLNHRHGKAAHTAQIADQAHQTNAQAALADYLIRKVDLGKMTLLAGAAVAGDDLVLRHLNRMGWNIDHLAATVHMLTTQQTVTVRTPLQLMGHGTLGNVPLASKRLLPLAPFFLLLLILLLLTKRAVRLDERRRTVPAFQLRTQPLVLFLQKRVLSRKLFMLTTELHNKRSQLRYLLTQLLESQNIQA